METNGKSLILQRTIGAAVLVAAAATLVPLVLDGDGIKSSREQVVIPDEPTFELQLDEHQQPKVRMLQAKGAIERSEQDAAAAAGSAEQGAVVDAPAEATDVAEALDALAGTPPDTDPAAMEAEPADSAPAQSPEPSVAKALPKEPSAAGAQTMEDVIQKLSQPQRDPALTAAVKAPVPATTSPSALGGDVAVSWTIQMGAFKDRANAEKTVNNLVAKGYRAYLGTQTPGVFRVFVGPEIRRDRADQLRDRVASDTGTRGVVVRYVP